MIRIFSPSTRDGVIRPDPVTAVNLAVHLAAFVLLMIPLGKVAKEEIFDRLMVYLVPPDQVGSREQGLGEAPVSAIATEPAGHLRGEVKPPGGDQVIPARGDLPGVDPADINTTPAPQPGDNALSVIEVDSAVVRDPSSAAPEYPLHLQAQGIEGSAFVRFVVDTTGLVDTVTYRVVRATHPDFAVAVRHALAGMRFRPAIRGGVVVRQLAEQTFTFRIAPRDTIRLRPVPPA
jgi:TonB family protein